MTDIVKYNVVYQGSKLFWRTRHTIDVTIVQHLQLDITEIIAFKPAINVEAKRIYLNSSILRTKLDHVGIDSKFSFAKQNDVPLSVEFADSVMNHAITDFILPRLVISELRKEERHFVVALEFRSSDKTSESGEDSIENLLCLPAAELQPYETKNHKRLAPGEVDAALKALEEEQCDLDAACVQAAVLEAEAHAPLSGKERWRIPIVLAKMDKGKVLDEEDAKIWEVVSRSLKTPAAIERATEVTVQTVTSPAQLAAEKAANKPLKSFRQVVEAVRPHYQPVGVTKVVAAGAETSVRAGGADAKGRITLTREKLDPSSHRPSSPRNHKFGESSGRIAAMPPTSSRLLASTAASHARANCTVEDSSPAAPKGNNKKPTKRSNNSKILHANNSKRSYRSSGRAQSRDNADAAAEATADAAADAAADPCASPEADHSGNIDHVSPLASIREDARANLASQVAAGLSSFVAATFSTKSKPALANVNADKALNGETIKRAVTADDTFAVEGFTRNNSLKTDPLVDTGDIKSRAVPAKRRSYFGALLATLVRGDSGQGNILDRANSSESLTNLNKNGDPSAQEMPLSKKPTGLKNWLPWRKFGATPVVPVE